MINFFQLLVIILAGIAVGIADALIKKTALKGSLWLALKSPWMLIILLLYFIQVVFFVYVFTHGWKLGVVGNAQMVFYSITVVLTGILIFGETLSLTQGIGIGLALVAVVLMNV